MSTGTKKLLHVSDDLPLPVDAATQTFAFIARKGAGKTYAAGKLVEELLGAGVQCVVLDTVGNWYGLRLAADGTGGKGKGFDVPVLGGLRGDIPLEAAGGELIADIISDTGRSLIIDVSQFSLGDRKRFAVTFGERLWKRKKGESHPSPLHLVIEESQLIVPQFVGGGGDVARMVGIYEEIIRLGRNYGIGVTMISQRPQSVNKEVLNQTECLFVGQVNGAQERDALKKWITHQGMDVRLVDDLPSLAVGTMYVWSPQWLQVLKKVRIGKKKTFDASSTPKVGENRVRRELKPLDLDDLKQKLAATIERKKADDPKALRAELARLRGELAKAQRAPSAAMAPSSAKLKTVEKLIVTDQQIQRLERLVPKVDAIVAKAGPLISGLQERTTAAAKLGDELVSGVKAMESAVRLAKAPSTPAAVFPTRTFAVPRAPHQEDDRAFVSRPAFVRSKPIVADNGDFVPNGAQRRVLNAIAWFESIGVNAPSRSAVGFVAGIKPTGGHFSNTTGPLSTRGLIEAVGDGSVRLTDAGRDLAALPEQPPTLDAYHDMIRGILKKKSGASVRIFDAIATASGTELTNEQIGELAGIDSGGGHFSNSIGPLGTLGLITRRGGVVAPTELMFPTALAD